MAEYRSCEICAYKGERDAGKHCSICIHNYTDQFKRATNADRIRSMTDEELAEELSKHHIDDEIKLCKNLKECKDILNKDEEIPSEKCEKCLLEWLQAESEGE